MQTIRHTVRYFSEKHTRASTSKNEAQRSKAKRNEAKRNEAKQSKAKPVGMLFEPLPLRNSPLGISLESLGPLHEDGNNDGDGGGSSRGTGARILENDQTN